MIEQINMNHTFQSFTYMNSMKGPIDTCELKFNGFSFTSFLIAGTIGSVLQSYLLNRNKNEY